MAEWRTDGILRCCCYGRRREAEGTHQGVQRGRAELLRVQRHAHRPGLRHPATPALQPAALFREFSRSGRTSATSEGSPDDEGARSEPDSSKSGRDRPPRSAPIAAREPEPGAGTCRNEANRRRLRAKRPRTARGATPGRTLTRRSPPRTSPRARVAGTRAVRPSDPSPPPPPPFAFVTPACCPTSLEEGAGRRRGRARGGSGWGKLAKRRRPQLHGSLPNPHPATFGDREAEARAAAPALQADEEGWVELPRRMNGGGRAARAARGSSEISFLTAYAPSAFGFATGRSRTRPSPRSRARSARQKRRRGRPRGPATGTGPRCGW